MTADIASMSVMFRRNWWVLLLRGIAAIVFGVLTWMQPAVSAAALVLVFGIYVLVDGLLGIFTAFKSRGESRHWWVVLLWGAVSALVGVLMLFQPVAAALVITIYVGVWALMTGVMEIVAAIRLRKEIQGEWLLILSGVLAVVLGLLFAANPYAGVAVTTLWIGIGSLLYGLLQVLVAFKLRKLK